MGPQSQRGLLIAVLAAGLSARLVLAFATFGETFDIQSMEIVASQLDSPGHLYSTVNPQVDFGGGLLFRWPYPPGFFLLIWIADQLHELTGLPFHGLVQIPAIVADLLIALIVRDFLGRRGATERVRLAATGLVLFGPTFVGTSGYHGQIDSVAILPAVLAVAIWQFGPPGRRALLAGALIGVGAAIKTVPGLAVLALLPTARSWRERLVLVGAAVAVPLATLLPFMVSDPHGVARLARYGAPPGAGGLSLVLQPGLAGRWVTDDPMRLSEMTRLLVDHRYVLTVAALAAVGGLLLWLRPSPTKGALLVWLTLYAVGTGFFPQYLVWGLPFLLMAGYVRAALALQATAVVPALIFYLAPWENRIVLAVYVPLMIALWVGVLVMMFLLIRGMVAERRVTAAEKPA